MRGVGLRGGAATGRRQPRPVAAHLGLRGVAVAPIVRTRFRRRAVALQGRAVGAGVGGRAGGHGIAPGAGIGGDLAAGLAVSLSARIDRVAAAALRVLGGGVVAGIGAAALPPRPGHGPAGDGVAVQAGRDVAPLGEAARTGPTRRGGRLPGAVGGHQGRTIVRVAGTVAGRLRDGPGARERRAGGVGAAGGTGDGRRGGGDGRAGAARRAGGVDGVGAGTLVRVVPAAAVARGRGPRVGRGATAALRIIRGRVVARIGAAALPPGPGDGTADDGVAVEAERGVAPRVKPLALVQPEPVGRLPGAVGGQRGRAVVGVAGTVAGRLRDGPGAQVGRPGRARGRRRNWGWATRLKVGVAPPEAAGELTA